MRHCIPCDSDFKEAPENCPTCGGITVDEEQLASWRSARDELTDQSFEVVAIVAGPVESGLFEQVFQGEGIPYILRTYSDDGLGMIFRPQRGWGILMVPHNELGRGRDLVREIRNSVPEAVEEP